MVILSRILAAVAILVLLGSAWYLYDATDYIFVSLEYIFLDDEAGEVQEGQELGVNEAEVYTRIAMVGMALRVSTFFAAVALVVLSLSAYVEGVLAADQAGKQERCSMIVWFCVSGLAGGAFILAALAFA